MKNRKFSSAKGLSALLFALLLTACGGDKPETMLASAKDYLAKNDSKAAVIQLKNALQNKPDLAEARFLLGKALFAEGKLTEAEVELRKAAELKYPLDQLALVQASLWLQMGQAKKVIDELASVEMGAPQAKADLQALIGQANLLLNQGAAARTAFDAALAAVPGHGQALIGQARLKAAEGDMPAALGLLDNALEKSPKLFDAWLLRGDILRFQNDMPGAIAAYTKALEAKPDYVAAHVALISRHMENNDLDNAEKQFAAMKTVAPSNSYTNLMQAELLYRKKDYKGAQEAIQQHLRLIPDSPQGLQLAGLIEYELKSYIMAEKHLLAALPKTPDIGIARRALIATYLQSGQPDKALSVLQPILDKIGKDSRLLALAGEVFMQNGDAEKAGSYFEKSVALDPDNKDKQTSVALSRLAKGDVESAYRDLEKIAATDTGTRADMALIASQMRLQRFDQALKAIDVLAKKTPESPLADNLRGMALIGKRDEAGARRSFDKALEKNPAYFPAAANLARLDIGAKKPDEARKRFESVVAKDPKNTQALLALAEMQARSGARTEDVAAAINKAVAANPLDVVSRLTLINHYLASKDATKALAAAQDALAALPNDLTLIDAEGRAQQASGNHNQALISYGKLATLLPHSVQPYLRMAEINLAAKDKTAAMQSLNKALAIQPNSIEAQRGIMMLDLDAGRIAEAVARARKVQQQYPKSPVGYLLEGDAHAFGKAWREAVVAYRSGLKLNASGELASKLHAALLAQNVAGEAEKFAESWVKEHPKDQVFRFYLAESANVRKDYAGAIKQYRVLLDGQPENPMLLNNLAWVMAQTKDAKALELAEKANQLAPEQPAIMDTLGGILVDKGELERGLELIAKAKTLQPHDPRIRFSLATALMKAGKKAEAKKELEELAAQGEKIPMHAEVNELLKNLK